MENPIKSYIDISKLYLGDCLDVMQTFETDSIDTIVTDPPYGLKFMNNKWDASVPSVEIWRECLRVLKPGAFAFIMSSPRQDVLSRMICNISDAGFDTNFSSIYWTYASGFPKAQNLSKIADKRAGNKREVIGVESSIPSRPMTKNWKAANELPKGKGPFDSTPGGLREITAPSTTQAKALEGAYSGMQLKPAVEIVIVAMKPLSEKTFVDQALLNGHGCTWLNDARIPYEGEEDAETVTKKPSKLKKDAISYVRHDEPLYGGTGHQNGRFPANVLCEDNVLDDGKITKSTGGTGIHSKTNLFKGTEGHKHFHYGDEGSYSHYFSLDAWLAERIKQLPKEAQKTFPWLIVPKASKAEKTKNGTLNPINNSDVYNGKFPGSKADKEYVNKHPTIKPLKLMMWLIILGTQEGDTVLDPFMGSGTTPIAAKATHRFYKGIEREKEFYNISIKRIDEMQKTIESFL